MHGFFRLIKAADAVPRWCDAGRIYYSPPRTTPLLKISLLHQLPPLPFILPIDHGYHSRIVGHLLGGSYVFHLAPNLDLDLRILP